MKVLKRGGRLGKYTLEKQLGSGGFSEVWRARDTVERRLVALKVATHQAVHDFGRDNLEKEAHMLVRLKHPHILPARNADWIDGRFVIATELAECSLAHYPRARRNPRIALEIVRQIASALSYAHGLRVMHRDVKPENILLFADGRAVLADFGVSLFAHTLDKTYTDAGTLGYLAPEQAYGRPGLGSDVFSLGVIAYQLLSGVILKWPFEWPSVGHERFAANTPVEVQPVLRKAVQFRPEHRYPNGHAFLVALERALARAAARETPEPTTPEVRRKAPARMPSPLLLEARQFKRLHGAKLGLKFACYRCEGPMSEAMTTCPWCGAGDHSLRQVTAYPLVCPECEHGVRPEWDYCPWCYAGRFEGNGKRPPRDAEATRRCTRKGCAGMLRPFMRYCPECKQKVTRPWTVDHLPDRCPRCRWGVSSEYWRYCPWCGRHEPRAGHFAKTRR